MANEKEIILDCECCGGRLIEVNSSTFKCDHCGYTKIIQTNFTTEIVSMINQANILRNKGEFDDAGDIFREVISKDENNPEGYWGVFLCDYGIMHVKDPVSKKYIPTCNRASSIPVEEDDNYNKALGVANDIKKEDLKLKGEVIETIRQKIVDLSSNEEPYDIFICYKRTQRIVDGKESYTEDAINARDIYDILSSEGYKVFFAEKTLQHLAGSEYEPLIYNAINTSKVMLVVCSDPAFINSPWVKNEWRRYLKQMEFDESKKILPIMCGGMKANRLPDLLKKFQGLEMNVNIKEHLLSSIAGHISQSRTVIQRVNIGDMKTGKRSSIIKQNVATRKIGENSSNEVRLSDANRIKLAYNYISKGMYEDAEREFSILMTSRELVSLIKFGQTYIKFKKRLTNDFDVDEFNICIENSNPQIANTIFTMMKNDFVEQIKAFNDKRASIIYSAIMKWEFDGSDEVLKVAENFVKNNPSGRSWFVFNAIADCFDSKSVTEYIYKMKNFAEYFLQNYSVYEGRVALSKVLDVDGGNIEVRWKLFLASFGAINEKCIKYCIKYLKKDKIKDFAEFLSYVPEGDRKQYIDVMTRAIVDAIKFCNVKDRYNDYGFRNYVINTLRSTSNQKLSLENPRSKTKSFGPDILTNKHLFKLKDKILDYQENTNNIDNNIPKDERLFAEMKHTTIVDKFNDIIKFYGEDEQDALIQSLYLIAGEFHKIREFEMATKFYNSIVAERNSEHKAYWKMLLCDIKCVDNIELTNTTFNLGEYDNFNKAVQTAGVYDEKQLEVYLTIRKEQESKRGSILKARREQKIRKLILLAGIIVSLGLLIWGFVSCNSDPKVTMLNYDGTVVEVLTPVNGRVYPNESLYTRPDDYYYEDYSLVGWSSSLYNITKDTKITAMYIGRQIVYDLNVECGQNGSVSIWVTSSVSDTVEYEDGKQTYKVPFNKNIIVNTTPDAGYTAKIYFNGGEFSGNYQSFNMHHFTTNIRVVFVKDNGGNSMQGTAISTAQDLKNIANNPSGDYYLTNDIDISGQEWVPIDGVNGFNGTLNGNEFSIIGLTMSPTSDYPKGYGLFGALVGAEIKNLKLTNIDVSITGELVGTVGGLAGSASNSEIRNVLVAGDINCRYMSYVGGLVGSFGGTMVQCISECNVNGANYVGGLIGNINVGAVSECQTRNAEISINEGGTCLGGCIGSAGVVNLSNLSNASIVRNQYNGTSVGGVVGSISIDAKQISKYSNLKNMANIYSGNQDAGDVGGIIGSVYQVSYHTYFPIFEGFVNQGDLTVEFANCVGGLIGYISGVSVQFKDCLNKGDISAYHVYNLNEFVGGGTADIDYVNCQNTGELPY